MRQQPVCVGGVEQTVAVPDDAALLDNHLAFLAAHRGAVRSSAEAIEVVGESEEFSAWIPLSSAAELPTGVSTVRLVPWSGAGWEERLLAAGFEPAEVLVHLEAPTAAMALTTPVTPTTPAAQTAAAAAAAAVDEEVVAAIGSEADAEAFAEVQAAAFLEVGEPDYDWWQRMFVEQAVRNYNAPDQSLYLLRVDGDPASITLVLRTGPVVGVYAEATKPKYRGRGLATRLLAQARRDTAGGRLTLQVVDGSPAERLYLKLGFRPAFRSPHFRRP
jgi:GNAT superfamily N-acetyltransferase